MSEFVIKGRHDGLSVEAAIAFSGRFAMPAEGLERLEKDLKAADKLPPVARAQRRARLEYLRDTAASHVAWALSLGGLDGQQIDAELARLRAIDEDKYFSVDEDVEARRIAGKRRYGLQEFLKGIIAEHSSTVDASPEA